MENEYNESGGAFLRAARTQKTDHVLDMARFLCASGQGPEPKNEKQTKGGAAAHGTGAKPGAGQSPANMA